MDSPMNEPTTYMCSDCQFETPTNEMEHDIHDGEEGPIGWNTCFACTTFYAYRDGLERETFLDVLYDFGDYVNNVVEHGDTAPDAAEWWQAYRLAQLREAAKPAPLMPPVKAVFGTPAVGNVSPTPPS